MSEKIPEMLTINECAQRVGLSYGQVRRMVLRGQIVVIECGRKRLINFDRFLDFLNGKTVMEEKHAD